MHSKLLTSFSVIALLGVSVASYASWIKYVEGDGKVPNGDCLEMICANGCVEEDGEFYGYCCPSDGKAGDSCRVDSGEDVNECCGEGLSCAKEGSNKGKCIKTCEGKQEDHPCEKCDVASGKWVADSTMNNKSINECGKCNNGAVITDSTKIVDSCHECNSEWKIVEKESAKVRICEGKCCPEGQTCNKETKECEMEDLCRDPNNVPLYEEKYKKNKLNGGQKTLLGCCPEDRIAMLPSEERGSFSVGYYTHYFDAAGALNGYEVGSDNKVACCPSERLYIKSKKKHCCAGKNDVAITYITDKGKEQTQCCPGELVYEEDGQKKCCGVLIDSKTGKYHKGHVYDNGKKCCKGRFVDGECLCSTGDTLWNEYGCKKCKVVDGEPKYTADSSKDGKSCGNCQYCSSGACVSKVGGIKRGSRSGEELCCDCDHCGNASCRWCPLNQPESACSASFLYNEIDEHYY